MLFGVLSINCQCTIWFYIVGHIFQPEMLLVLHICPDILCLYWCFINVTIIFGAIAFLAKYYLVIDHIINSIVRVTFLFGVSAISLF